ncbi:MAG: DinB family protein [Phaeodactylibacter sp.]|nr:DinB family protein [Phaeodactylibacter sp.]HQU58370.1 DinB family protein [Saprospiraceae bacterium]
MDPFHQSVIARIERASVEAEKLFGQLTEAQLNWKPSPQQWSIGQCLEHLIWSNRLYFPQLKELAGNTKKYSFWERLPLWHRFWGWLLLRSITPEPKAKMKAPKVFEPHQNAIVPEIVQIFKVHNQQVVQHIRNTRNLDFDRPHITSPAASFITYSLRDAFTILANHEERHLLQARRVMEMEGFPRE